MTTTSAVVGQSSAKAVDGSLWWESFTQLLSELENVSLSSDIPSFLVKKLKNSHVWLLGAVSLFKPPSQTSREALNSQQVNVGQHRLIIRPELKDMALQISATLRLDEVQSYILVDRFIEQNNAAVDHIVQEFLHMILLHHYIERQCILKCTRQILMHALYVGTGHAIREEALKLISDGLESKLLSVFLDLLSCSHPENMDVDLITLWAEETLIEANLVLDILFVAYYESFCTCNGERWKNLCSLYKGIICGDFNFGKLAVSAEAVHSVYQAKAQLLLILIETLDLETLLQMVHDEVPFRDGSTFFSSSDVLEVDAIISTLNALETKEAGPLILAWAVFLCLITSLPGKEENNLLMDIDHGAYVRQAFEAASLSWFLEILQSDILINSDGPIAGYRSVLRTFVSAFIASYEINLQLEDSTFKMILEILCNIYRGEELLCIQFWDKDSFIDGPIRCLLCNLEGEFPYRTVELVQFLSALCEGSWPAECVYTFLDKFVGISTVFEINRDTLLGNMSQMVESHLPLHVPQVEGFIIPSRTRGHVVKMVDGNTALVRWEHTQSGVFILLLRLAQSLYFDCDREVIVTLDLLNRMMSFNQATCFALMDLGNSMNARETHITGQMQKIDLVEIICNLVRNLSSNPSNARVMSLVILILAKMLKCSPSHVTAVALKSNVFDLSLKTNSFDVGGTSSSSDSWLLSGRLAKMLFLDSEQNDSSYPLSISVLELTEQLIEAGVENDVVLALIVFSQHILVNHEYWKYKARHVRWEVTLKVLEVLKKCIVSVPRSQKMGEIIWDMLLCDSSIHNTLFRVICRTAESLEKLYVSRLWEPKEIQGLEAAICSVLDILSIMLSDFSKDFSSGSTVFHQAMMSSTKKPCPIVTSMISLISHFRNPEIQVGATRLLSMLCIIGDHSPPYLFGTSCFGPEDKQIADFRRSVYNVLSEQFLWNENLFVAVLKLLTSAARYQPAFLISVLDDKGKAEVLEALLQFAKRSDDLINSNPRVWLNVLNFLQALWQGASQYTDILKQLRSSGRLWKELSKYINIIAKTKPFSFQNLYKMEAQSLAYKYQCQAVILEIVACDMFLQRKLQLLNQKPDLSKEGIENGGFSGNVAKELCHFKDILSLSCDQSILGDLIQSSMSFDYDNEVTLRAKIAASLFAVHVMGKLATGDAGSLSVSLSKKIHVMFKKLSALPAFTELAAQYSQQGYSGGKELDLLILSDLYYHLQGELEGRKIESGPYKELSYYLLDSDFLQSYRSKSSEDLFSPADHVYLFNTLQIKTDMGLDLWKYSQWKPFESIGERMLICIQEANLMLLLSSSKLSALRAVVSVLSLNQEESTEDKSPTKREMSKQLNPSWIDHICRCFHSTLKSLSPVFYSSETILHFLAAQVELLLSLLKSNYKMIPINKHLLVLETSALGLRMLNDFIPSVAAVQRTMKLLLMLLLSSLECISFNLHSDNIGITEVRNTCLRLLPVLCNCLGNSENYALSLTVIDLMIKHCLVPNTWFPILQKHLQIQLLIQKLRDKDSLNLVPIILKFLLTLSHVKEGAEMLLISGFFPSLKLLFEKPPQHIWGLGLSVITSMIHSLGESSTYLDFIDSVINYFFKEKVYLISFYLNNPPVDFASDDRPDRKRARSQKRQTTLSSLKETENTLVLICLLAKNHRSSWVKAMKETDSQLRERSIHLLAFFSQATSPLLCPPLLKEEIDSYRNPSFVRSRNAWFALSALGCVPHSRSFSDISNKTTALILEDQSTENTTGGGSSTYFADTVGVQIYKISFLLLKYLLLEAKGAAKRAEELGFVDLAHFPELPMPEILHGLQNQAIAIVTEICDANKIKLIQPEIQSLCLLLLQIMEMSLYLELCVSQICGIRPVLGHVEGFSKEVKLLIKATEKHAFLKASMTELKRIMSLVFPHLSKAERFS